MFNQDFKEFVELLEKHKVKYLIVGGYALAAHGYPRYTGDIDFWLEKADDNAERVLLALRDFGFGGLGITEEDFLADNVIQLGYPPNRIDLITSISGVSFEDAWKNKFELNSQGLTLNFIGINDLKTNKRASGRSKDLQDLDNLP